MIISMHRTHPCAAPDCPARIPTNLLLCKTHWRLVPAKIQAGLSRAWWWYRRKPVTQNLTAYKLWRQQAIASVTPQAARSALECGGESAKTPLSTAPKPRCSPFDDAPADHERFA